MKGNIFFVLTGVMFVVVTALNGELVLMTDINPHIMIEMRYATADNFMGRAVYPSAHCYLQRSTAEKLNRVQQELEKMGLGLKIWDAYRPAQVQEILWKITPDKRYVRDPKLGSNHSRGAAVDCTLVDKNGHELLMPSGFDEFSEKAHRNYTKASQEVLQNRQILEDVMVKYGFDPLPHEWWHFNDKDCLRYPLLAISFADLELV